MKLLAGKPEALNQRLISCDVWSGRFQSILSRGTQTAERARGENSRTWMGMRSRISRCAGATRSRFMSAGAGHLDELGRRIALGPADGLHHNEFLLRFRAAPYEMTVFTDGRAIVKGTKDPAVARSLYARYIGA